MANIKHMRRFSTTIFGSGDEMFVYTTRQSARAGPLAIRGVPIMFSPQLYSDPPPRYCNAVHFACRQEPLITFDGERILIQTRCSFESSPRDLFMRGLQFV